MNTLDLVGECGYVEEGSKYLFLPDRLWQIELTDESKIFAKWLTYIFVFLKDRGEISKLATGTSGSMKNISKERLLKLKICIPSFLEQKKIAEVISSLDKSIAHTQSVIDQIQVVKRGLMQQLLSHGIPGWHEISEIRTQELSTVSRKITDGSHQSVKVCADGTVPFLYVSCVRHGKIRWEQTAQISIETYREISKGREPKSGVILYTAVGSYGEAVMLKSNKPLAFQRHIAYIDPNTEKVEPRFLAHWLNSYIARSQADQVAVGNAQKTVTLGDLAHFKVPIFPLDEQRKIADVLDSVDQRLQAERDKKTQLEITKKGLMQQLLTGKRRVPVDTVKPVGGG